MTGSPNKSFPEQFHSCPLLLATTIVLALTCFFLLVPELDPWISGFFYDEEHRFWLKKESFPIQLRRLGIFVPRMIAFGLIVFFIARLFWPNLRKLFPLDKMLFLALAALLGPGLLVNGILKAHWGRARPVQTDQFGGEWPFSEVWVIANNCQNNCSFVSGEGAMSFWMLGLAFLLPLGWRKLSLWLLAIFAFFVSFNRIAFGGHYFSDILMSWALTFWVMVALWQLLSSDKLAWYNAENLEKKWDQWGEKTRYKLAELKDWYLKRVNGEK